MMHIRELIHELIDVITTKNLRLSIRLSSFLDNLLIFLETKLVDEAGYSVSMYNCPILHPSEKIMSEIRVEMKGWRSGGISPKMVEGASEKLKELVDICLKVNSLRDVEDEISFNIYSSSGLFVSTASRRYGDVLTAYRPIAAWVFSSGTNDSDAKYERVKRMLLNFFPLSFEPQPMKKERCCENKGP